MSRFRSHAHARGVRHAVWAPWVLPAAQFCYDARALAAAMADLDPVGTCGDLTTMGRPLAAANGPQSPTFVAAGLNGLPTIRFDGIDDMLTTPTFASLATLTLVVVFQMRSVSGGVVICSGYNGVGGVSTLESSAALGMIIADNSVHRDSPPALVANTPLVGVANYNTASPALSSIARNQAAAVTGTMLGNARVRMTFGAYDNAGPTFCAPVDLSFAAGFSPLLDAATLARVVRFAGLRYNVAGVV